MIKKILVTLGMIFTLCFCLAGNTFAYESVSVDIPISVEGSNTQILVKDTKTDYEEKIVEKNVISFSFDRPGNYKYLISQERLEKNVIYDNSVYYLDAFVYTEEKNDKLSVMLLLSDDKGVKKETLKFVNIKNIETVENTTTESTATESTENTTTQTTIAETTTVTKAPTQNQITTTKGSIKQIKNTHTGDKTYLLPLILVASVAAAAIVIITVIFAKRKKK